MARREVAEGLALEPRYQEVTMACRHGLQAEADLAEAGRARRQLGEVAEARARADELLAIVRGVLAGFADPASPTVRWVAADLATAEAESGRLDGASDAGAWAAVAARWTALQQPYEAAYARYREGEALMTEGHHRAEAEAALGAAHAVVVGLGARPLQARIEELARRGRLKLEPSSWRRRAWSASGVVVVGFVGRRRRRSSSSSSSSVGGDSADPFGLTVREREVLALLAEGLTNRQIGEALFISASTAGVHVSNILAKLGVTSRTEAAAIAVRLGLAS